MIFEKMDEMGPEIELDLTEEDWKDDIGKDG